MSSELPAAIAGVERLGAPDAPRIAWFLHGILGRGRNWRTFARRMVTEDPGCQALLVDLRCHGDAPARPAPHTLAACGRDLAELADLTGQPHRVIGHSFGGKVALTWLEHHATGRPTTWVLDSPPGTGETRSVDPLSDPVFILGLLRSVPVPAADRGALRAPLIAAGLPETLVAWLLTSTRHDAGGWTWCWDLDGVEQMLEDYLRTDLWGFLARTDQRVGLVRAGRSERWGVDDDERPVGPNVSRHLLPDAGHWVHVDAPDAVFALITSP
ncbi:MAG: alpha/beta hydrolase [Alphaproteobacteria bacterium]|nr:alpha/beta hydrolase [Alphaproteobacteria bacterium]